LHKRWLKIVDEIRELENNKNSSSSSSSGGKGGGRGEGGDEVWREQETLTTKGGVGGGSSSNSSNNKKRPLDEVKQQRRELERQLVDLRHELKKRILNEADIVLSTLSGAGGQIFTKVMKVPFYTEHKRKLHTHKSKHSNTTCST